MIYDLALYNGEKYLLKISCEELRQLSHLKVKHIFLESKYTFTGIEKPRQFTPDKWDFDYNIEWFYDESEPDINPWVNETRQRNLLKQALKSFSPADDDIVIIRDMDECPRAYAVQHYRPDFGLVALQLDQYYLYLNTLAERNNWNIAKIMSWEYLDDKTCDEVRRSGYDFALVKAGYHFSYLGDVDTLLRKFASFSHQEPEVQRMADRELLQRKIDNAESIWGPDKLSIVNLEELPYYVQTHLEEFKHLLYVRP